MCKFMRRKFSKKSWSRIQESTKNKRIADGHILTKSPEKAKRDSKGRIIWKGGL